MVIFAWWSCSSNSLILNARKLQRSL
jgi:hypothetical protein